VQKGNNGTHRTLDFAVDFVPGEEVPHLNSRTARLRATCHKSFSRIAPGHRILGDSRGPRTKRPSWIRILWTWSEEYQRAVRKREITQSSGSWISRSRGVNPTKSVRFQRTKSASSTRTTSHQQQVKSL